MNKYFIIILILNILFIKTDLHFYFLLFDLHVIILLSNEEKSRGKIKLQIFMIS